MIAHAVNRLAVWRNLHSQRLKACHARRLTLAWVTWPKDLARTGVAGGTYVQGATALGFMLMPGRHVPRLGRRRRRHTTTRRPRGVFVDGQDHRVITPWTRVELDEC